MAKDLLTIDPEIFEKECHKISTSQIKQLIEGIYELKWTSGHTWGQQQIQDMERKQSKLERILQERSYLSEGNRADYFKWCKDMNYKRRFY